MTEPDNEQTDFYTGYKLAKQYDQRLESVSRTIGDFSFYVWIALSIVLVVHVAAEFVAYDKFFGFAVVAASDIAILCGIGSSTIARWIVRKPKVLRGVIDVER